MARRAIQPAEIEAAPESDQIEGAPHPRLNEQLFGHEGAEAALLEAWNAGKMPHAVLLTGPKGIGKASFAYRLARFVLADTPAEDALFGGDDMPATSLAVPHDTPVGERISALSHGDLKVMRRAWDGDKKRFKANITVEDARSLLPFFGSTASEGGWRVAIVDAVEDMNRAAANAILKTLEEPPQNALLILVSHAPGRLLPTIRSRCRKVALQPLEDDACTQALAALGLDASGPDGALLKRLSGGRPGRAVELTHAEGLELFQTFTGLMESRDMKGRSTFAATLGNQKNDARFRLLEDLLADWLATMARCLAVGQGAEALTPSEQALMARAPSPMALGDMIEAVHSLFSETIGLNLERRQMLLRLFDTLDGAWLGR